MDDRDFARNRAEEYGYDVWESFIVPPFYREIESLRTNKPLIVEGGRGSGKTMLLRYWCHQTQFSESRTEIPDSALKKIGIYWKMDTQFAAFMLFRNYDEEIWNRAFSYWSVLTISLSILDSLKSVAMSHYPRFNKENLDEMRFSGLNGYDENIPESYNELIAYLTKRRQHFESWVNSIPSPPTFNFLPYEFIVDLANCIKKGHEVFKETVFDIFIDEYENLQVNQMHIINTRIKHSEIPIIYNVAMKRNALVTPETLGNESIVVVNDYRKIQLDELVEEHFKVFAPEIFLWKLKKDKEVPTLVEKEELFSYDDAVFEKRKSEKYRRDLGRCMNTIFPGMTEKEVAALMLEDSVFKNRIAAELRKKHIQDQDVETIMNSKPECVVVFPSLLERASFNLEDTLMELAKYNEGKKSKFDDIIHNSLFGCILYQYGSLNRTCPLYAGFGSFITMSKDNLRHFLELCYHSYLRKGQNDNVSIATQCITVKMVSEDMVSEIKSLGRRSNELYTFALRLGSLFETSRKKPSQSEPEQNQFNIVGPLQSNDTESLLRELVKWSVLYESKLTKQKADENGVEYLFNPIYAPYFGISYRKKRRVPFSLKDFEILAFGDELKYKSLVLRKTKFNGDEYSRERSLFDL